MAHPLAQSKRAPGDGTRLLGWNGAVCRRPPSSEGRRVIYGIAINRISSCLSSKRAPDRVGAADNARRCAVGPRPKHRRATALSWLGYLAAAARTGDPNCVIVVKPSPAHGAHRGHPQGHADVVDTEISTSEIVQNSCVVARRSADRRSDRSLASTGVSASPCTSWLRLPDTETGRSRRAVAAAPCSH